MWPWRCPFSALSFSWLICRVRVTALTPLGQLPEAVVRIRFNKGWSMGDSRWHAVYIWGISTASVSACRKRQLRPELGGEGDLGFDGVNTKGCWSQYPHISFVPGFPNWRILPNVRLDLFGDTADMNCKEAMTEMGILNEAKLYSLVSH